MPHLPRSLLASNNSSYHRVIHLLSFFIHITDSLPFGFHEKGSKRQVQNAVSFIQHFIFFFYHLSPVEILCHPGHTMIKLLRTCHLVSEGSMDGVYQCNNASLTCYKKMRFQAGLSTLHLTLVQYLFVCHSPRMPRKALFKVLLFSVSTRAVYGDTFLI